MPRPHKFRAPWSLHGSAALLLGIVTLLACRPPRNDPPPGVDPETPITKPMTATGGTGGAAEPDGGARASTDVPTMMPAGPCTEGETRCAENGEATEVCRAGGWMMGETCPAKCQAGACIAGTPGAATCAAGTHDCNGMCVSDMSPSSCNRACVPCAVPTGGAAECDGLRCKPTCPPGQQVCEDKCVPLDAPCADKCIPGKNLCNRLCVEATDVTACGSSCTSCPTSPNGKTSCDGDKCDLACNPGYHRCGNACAKDDDPQSCGTSCTPCEVPAGGKAGCDKGMCTAICPGGTFLCMGACIANGRSCGGVCPNGKHDCSGNCLVNDSPNSCGASCKPCTPPANADATCNGNSCGYKCRGGFHDCGGQCKDDKSAQSCGSMCTPCTAPAGAKPACRNGSCDFDCTSGRRCNQQCIPDSKPCDGKCPNGMTDCRGTCVPSASVTAESCDGKDNDCNGVVDDNLAARPCSPACAGNQVCMGAAGWSSAQCARTDSDPNRCGNSCSKCQATGGATATCVGGVCKQSCQTGRLCPDGTCQPVDINHCGPQCSVCPERAGYRTTCTAQGCSYQCALQCCADSDCAQGCISGQCRLDLSGNTWTDGPVYGNTIRITQNKTQLTYSYIAGPQTGLVIMGEFISANQITYRGNGTQTATVENKNRIPWPSGAWTR